MKPKTLTMGTAMSAPLSRPTSVRARTRRMISMPLASSPWIDALSQRCGPASRPLTTMTGSCRSEPDGRRTTGITSSRRSPGATV
jgi:hypothetical protein